VINFELLLLILEIFEVYCQKKLNVMALTATATRTTLSSVNSRLAMVDPVIVGLPPDRSNIKMIVEPYPDLSELCKNLAKDLHENHSKTIKTVVF